MIFLADKSGVIIKIKFTYTCLFLDVPLYVERAVMQMRRVDARASDISAPFKSGIYDTDSYRVRAELILGSECRIFYLFFLQR